MMDTTWPTAAELPGMADDDVLAVVWTMPRGDHVIWSKTRAPMAMLPKSGSYAPWPLRMALTATG